MNRIADRAPLPPTGADAQQLRDWCLARLAHFEGEAGADPLTVPVWRVAYELYRADEEGRSDRAALAAAAKLICDEALIARARNFAQAHGEAGGDLTRGALARFAGGAFAEVRSEIERTRAGIVFTAHPTFALSAEMRRAVGAFASAASPEEERAASAAIAAARHAPDPEITLAAEHEAAQTALLRAQATLRAVAREIFAWARRHYPDEWTQLSPAPVSLASWVGYDIDGRTDIHWGETFRIRLDEKALQLFRYAQSLKSIDVKAARERRDGLVAILEGAAQFAREQSARFSGDLDDPAIVTRAANTLTRDDKRRLVTLEPIVAALDELIGETADDDARLELCVLRTEMRNYGLGIARIHLRVNAAQVRSAVRADLGVDQGREFIDRTTLTIAAQRASAVTRRKINVASIFLEQMTARRQLMLCAEFLKHIDADTPIRFLIAECEAPATVMGAIYLARLYGVDHRLDISPLFETPEAMERGGRFMERLLSVKEFVEFTRARGRLAIQIGFSDSGRFMGQVAANLAIERLQILVARALAERDIRDVEVVIFNTHGESMGRGGYPGSLSERFDYLMTPWARSRYAHEAIAVNAEASFQGGDGFLHFETDALARATIAALLRWSFSPPAAAAGDCFYTDINYSWDFYRGVQHWQETLFENPDYHVAITAFAQNLLFATGSRKVRRQSGTATSGPRALRAIPHNAILQQLAAPANVFGGAGQTAGAEPDRLVDHVKGSGRMKQVIGIVRRARELTSLSVVRAYAALFDAGFWIGKAAGDADVGRASSCAEIAAHLADQKTPNAIGRLANLFAADLAKLDRVLPEIGRGGEAPPPEESRRAMHALHAIRQAMIMKAFVLVAGLPSFSSRHDVSRALIFELAFQLRFDELADLLDLIFPATDASAAALSAIEEEGDNEVPGLRGYPEIHANVVAPLREIHQAIREIGVGLSHFYGAYG